MPGEPQSKREEWPAWLDRKLSGITLHRRNYFLWRPGWDHDHCAFCWRKFVVAGNRAEPEDASQGWTTDSEYYWICDACFEKYLRHFGWKVRDSLPTDHPDTPPPSQAG